MQKCLEVHSVSSISLIGLLITGNTPYTNLHLKIGWKFHLLHTVAIHLLMGCFSPGSLYTCAPLSALTSSSFSSVVLYAGSNLWLLNGLVP